jgi:hypothetical protein
VQRRSRWPKTRMPELQQAELEKQIAEELETQKEELEKQLAHMDRIYEESHSAIARQLLAKIVAR